MKVRARIRLKLLRFFIPLSNPLYTLKPNKPTQRIITPISTCKPLFILNKLVKPLDNMGI